VLPPLFLLGGSTLRHAANWPDWHQRQLTKPDLTARARRLTRSQAAALAPHTSSLLPSNHGCAFRSTCPSFSVLSHHLHSIEPVHQSPLLLLRSFDSTTSCTFPLTRPDLVLLSAGTRNHTCSKPCSFCSLLGSTTRTKTTSVPILVRSVHHSRALIRSSSPDHTCPSACTAVEDWGSVTNLVRGPQTGRAIEYIQRCPQCFASGALRDFYNAIAARHLLIQLTSSRTAAPTTCGLRVYPEWILQHVESSISTIDSTQNDGFHEKGCPRRQHHSVRMRRPTSANYLLICRPTSMHF
jgi:hypothetical protein